jgi:hypothetical protein
VILILERELNLQKSDMLPYVCEREGCNTPILCKLLTKPREASSLRNFNREFTARVDKRSPARYKCPAEGLARNIGLEVRKDIQPFLIIVA